MKKFTSIILLTLLAFNIIAIATVAAQPTTRISVIVGFKDKPDQNLVTTHGGTIKYNYKIINAIAASLPTQAIEALKRNPNVLYVEPVQEFQAVDAELDASWGVTRIGAGIVHTTYTGAGIQVAVLDTGIDYNHPDLNDNYIGGIDLVNNDNDPLDDNGHGTHCAGIIAAEDNGAGVVGVAPEAELLAVKVLNRRGSGYTDDIIAGIEWAVSHGADVISMSLGALYTPPTIDPYEEACNTAFAAGTVVVASSGNNGILTENAYPAAYESVIAVGATDINDNVASFSNYGDFLEIVAPGVNVLSTLPTYRVTLSKYGYTYGTLSGTSMACPHVAGVAALVFESGLTSASDVRAILDSTADPLSVPTIKQGNGLVDADKAVNVQPPAPDTTSPLQVKGLTVTPTSASTLNLDWNDNTETDLHHYNIYQSTVSSFTPNFDNLIAQTTESQYTATGLEASTTYYYKVSAIDTSQNEGPTSTEESATTQEASLTNQMMATCTTALDSRVAGKNDFYWGIATVEVTDTYHNPLEGATVYGHWEAATSDTEIGTTNNSGIVTFTSDSVKNDSTATFTFVIDNVVLAGYDYVIP